MPREFDAIIIGAGQAGPSLAGRLTAAGMSVALVERKLVGGTCVNTGCMPTKTLIASAQTAHVGRRAADFGVQVGQVTVDMAAVAARAAKVVLDARTGNERWLASMDGLTLFRGHARFTGVRSVSVDGETLTASKIFINVGGRASSPDIPGIDAVPHLDNVGMIGLADLPEHLVVIGGSYIGLEFAQMYRRFGAAVTVVERAERLVPHEDHDVSDAIREILEGEGVTVRTGATCIALAKAGEAIEVSLDCGFGEPRVVASHLLLATGRRPNTDDLDLHLAGVDVDARGYVVVREDLQTSASGIWALGDCNGRGAFTHTAYNDFEIVAANLLDGESRSVDQRVRGYALYTDPPLGRVGLTEAEALALGRSILVSKRPMSRVGRAVEKGETKGFLKIVADRDTQRIMGAAFLGTGCDEAIHGVLDMMSADRPLSELRWAVPIHPTVSELIPTLLLGLSAVGSD